MKWRLFWVSMLQELSGKAASRRGLVERRLNLVERTQLCSLRAQTVERYLGACTLTQRRWLRGVSTATDANALETRKRRCLYRANQRGLRELDILLGEWTQRHLATFTEQDVSELEQVLDHESPLLYLYITEQRQPPAELARLALFQRLVRETRQARS